MKCLGIIFVLSFLVSSCAWSNAPDSLELREAEVQLYRFIESNGYGETLHPSDRPIRPSSLWDGMFTEEELRQLRHKSLVGQPFCVLEPSGYPYTFIFRHQEGGDEIFQSVVIEGDGTGWVNEANPIVTKSNCYKMGLDDG